MPGSARGYEASPGILMASKVQTSKQMPHPVQFSIIRSHFHAMAYSPFLFFKVFSADLNPHRKTIIRIGKQT